MKQRVAEMEMEANKLRELQAAAEQANAGDDSGSAMETDDDKAGADGRSVYVGNVSHIFFFCPQILTENTLRWITVLLQKKYKDTSRHVVQSTE